MAVGDDQESRPQTASTTTSFVDRLRGEVEAARLKLELQPSTGTWLTPRSGQPSPRGGAAEQRGENGRGNSLSLQSFVVGGMIEYYSEAFGGWLPGVVDAVRDDGSLRLLHDNGNVMKEIADPSECRVQTWHLRPSIGTWLLALPPRRRRRRGDEDAVAGAAGGAEPAARPGAPAPRRSCHFATMSLSFKGTCVKPFKLTGLERGLTIGDLKVLCQQECSLPPEQLRVFYKGKLLHDAQRLEGTTLNVPDGATIFLAKGMVEGGAAASSSSSSAGAAAAPDARSNGPPSNPVPMGDGPLCWECEEFPGREQTDGLCSYCFRRMVIAKNRELRRALENEKLREKERLEARLHEEKRKLDEEHAREEERRKKEEEDAAEQRRQKDVNRCYMCGKRIGITGFSCRCGYFFCATHRYAEDHNCTFDHRTHGREILAQQNPAPERAWRPS